MGRRRNKLATGPTNRRPGLAGQPEQVVGGQKALVLPERVLMETAPMPLQYKLHDDAANKNKNNCPNKNKWWACRWPSLFLNAWSPQQGQRNCRRLVLGMLEQK